jgi:hypothetical protein
MRAVLVGLVSADKLYYVLDAGASEKDGAIEKENGSVIMVDFFPFVATVRGLRKVRSSRFHRKLWDAPKSIASGSWHETFIRKSKAVDEALLDSYPVYSALGKNRKKADRITKTIEKVKKKSLAEEILVKSANAPMVKFDRQNYAFKTAEQRKEAWIAMCILRQIEENDNA